jgi:hypothetical protein
VRQQRAGRLPVCAMLQAFYIVKVNAVEHQPGGMKSAQALPDDLVDLPVVR